MAGPVEVLVDLCIKEDTLDETLSYLLKKAKQRRSLLHLRCQKLRIFTIPVQSIRRILKLVQLDSIQDVEVNCTWKLATLGRFLPHLGRMGNLRRLLLSRGNAGSIPRSGRSPGEGHGNPLQYSCLENPMDRGGWWATVHGVAKSQT